MVVKRSVWDVTLGISSEDNMEANSTGAELEEMRRQGFGRMIYEYMDGKASRIKTGVMSESGPQYKVFKE